MWTQVGPLTGLAAGSIGHSGDGPGSPTSPGDGFLTTTAAGISARIWVGAGCLAHPLAFTFGLPALYASIKARAGFPGVLWGPATTTT